MTSQTSNGAGGAINLEIANNLTTGALSLGSDGQSSDITINTGTGDLICNTGSIVVGDDEASPQIQVGGTGSTSRAIIDANSSRARVHGSLGPLLISSQSSVNVTPNGGSSLALHDLQTSGDLLIGTSASRTGTIDIGNSGASGDITIDAGSGDVNILGANVNIPSAPSSVTKGSWTPRMTLGGTTVPQTLQLGTYARLGPICYVTFRVSYGIIGTFPPNVDLEIQDFPFASTDPPANESAFTIFQSNAFNFGSQQTVHSVINSNLGTKTLFVSMNTDGNTTANVTRNSIVNDKIIKGCGWYFVG